jgi:hypothetical protein
MDAIFWSQDSPFKEPLISSVIVVDIRERVSCQFINRADNVAKVVLELDKSCVGPGGAFPSPSIKSCSENVAAHASPMK